MSTNPWKPPSGWDEVAVEHARAAWTIRGVLDRVSLALQRQPLGVLLAVCVLPGLWMVPAHLAEELLVPADEPWFGPAPAPCSGSRSSWTLVAHFGKASPPRSTGPAVAC